MMNQQLELGVQNQTMTCRSTNRRRVLKSTRATWWFDKMRQVVDAAVTIEPAPVARPQQTWFPE